MSNLSEEILKGITAAMGGTREGTVFKVSIDQDAKCKRCGKGWAAESGYCMKCINKALKLMKGKR